MFAKDSRSIENPSTPLYSVADDPPNWIVGDSITEQQAMRLAAVYSCIYVLSSSIAQLPLHVMRKKGKEIETARDHAAYEILHSSPSFWQTSYKWRETTMAHCLGWGNGYSEIIRNDRGELQAIESIEPFRVELKKSGDRWRYDFKAEGDHRPRAISPYDMIHLRALGSNGKVGISPIRQNREAMALGLSAQDYGNKFFAGGGRASGVLTLKDGTAQNAQKWETFKQWWNKAATALKSSDNKTMLLPGDMEYKALSIAPEDAQFLDTRKFNRSEIAGIFNVPAHMIGDLEKATFSNITEQSIQFVRHCIMPWVVNIEQELNRRIFTRQERRAGYYVKLNLAGLLRGTPSDRAEFYHKGITDGWLDRNEVRQFEDLNPRDGLSEMLISVNAQPASQIGKEEQPNDD